MPPLILRFKKKADADCVLTFVRADGSHSSQPIGAHSGFGPVHDLSHYVVESILGLSQGFLGLCAGGWTFEDFEVKGSTRRLPPEAIVAEVTAGELSRFEMMGETPSLEEFNWAVGEAACGRKGGNRMADAAAGQAIERWRAGVDLPVVTAAQFEDIRRALHWLWARWNETPVGGTLELTFQPGRVVQAGPAGELDSVA
jgi:hypothetical protein